MFDLHDTLYTETAPNGSISASRGKRAIYKNGSTYEFWENIDGGTVWQRVDYGAYTETDPIVKAINGIVKSNGTTISAAVAGTDYLQSIAAGSINTTALKTATGEVSLAGANQANTTLPGGAYGFYPQARSSISAFGAIHIVTDYVVLGTSYTTNIGLEVGAGDTFYAQQRYVTASGEDMWIFLLVDKTTKDILGAYAAPDHPAYGNGGDFNKLPHPFGSYDETKHEIILVDNETIAELKSQVTEERSLLTIVNEEYCLDKDKEYKPLHSGKYLTENKDGEQIQVKQLIETIPSYIKVKSLRKMTIEELFIRETKRQEKEALRQQELQQKKIKLNTLKQKLNLSDEEFSLLKEAI